MTQTNTGIGFIGLLTLIFVVAKIWGLITWSWWWVFSPLWISLVVVLIITGIILLIAFLTRY